MDAATRRRWVERSGDNAQRSGDVVVIGQLPPPVHGQNLMTQALLGVLDTQSIRWRLIDKRFSKTIGEVGRFSARKVAQGLGLFLRLGVAVARRRPQVVVLFATTNSFSFLVDWLLSELLRASRVPVILYLQTVGFSRLAQRGRIWRHAVGRLLGSAEATVILGESLEWDVNAFIKARADVIGNTVQELPPAPVAEVPREARNTVVFLSNLIPGKGHDDFLAAAAMCLDAGINAKFILAGSASPSVAAEVNANIAHSGWDSHISYIGAVGSHEKWALLSSARVFVFPSSYAYEASPVVLLEAAACGLPIAAYPTGDLPPRFAAAGAAYVVDAGNCELLAGAIRDIVESPELSERLGARAQALFVEEFSYSAYATSWMRILDRFGVRSSGNENSG